ncbi:MAG: hypothetical protein COS89_00850 [Deltaproteobacteria bacterium CG07_land_8_20_14_0_80_38_7]|nr:MAG: hypothetical protein COS89_00850 [Deltaproteobacteria bacterium CG07_land_8_20_14_0_80_38_7]
MNKKIAVLGITACLISYMGYVKEANALFNGAETNISTDVNSRNAHETTSRNDVSGSMHTDTNSHNYNRNDYNWNLDTSNHNSHNTTHANDNSVRLDSSDNSTKTDQSFHDSHNYSETYGGDNRTNSNDYIISGKVRNTNIGDFTQNYVGTGFSGGVSGNKNTIDASSVNITTFGDSITKERLNQ